jgi:hypothetical protein
MHYRLSQYTDAGAGAEIYRRGYKQSFGAFHFRFLIADPRLREDELWIGGGQKDWIPDQVGNDNGRAAGE